MPGMVCGVDIGGTFTDCVLIGEDGKVAYGKALSSPADSFKSGFFGSIESAGDQLGLEPGELYTKMDRLISHGSTVATNIVVERKGAAIGLITTRGFEDTVRTMRGLGRPTGEPPENLLRFAETRKPEPLVPIERTFGVAERIDSDGDVVVELDEEAVAAAADALVEAGVETIAIAFLWSVRNDAHERRAREIVRERAPETFVTISSEISKSVGEYARAVRGRTGGGAEIVVDCSGAVPALEAAMEMTRRGGRVVIAGIPKQPVPVDPGRMVLYERSLIATLGYANDLPRVARMIASGALDPSVMITKRIPLSEVAAEIERMASDPRDEVKVLAEVGS